MNDRRREILTGLFVLVAIAVLAGLTLWIAGADPWSARRAQEVLMKDAGGVRAGDQVRVAGIAVGRIESVALTGEAEWPVRLEVRLDPRVDLTREASAKLARDGFLGAPFLAVDPGPPGAPPLPEGEPVHGTAAGGIEEMMARLDEIAAQTQVLLEETTHLVRTMPGELEPLLGQLEALLSEKNVAQISASLASLRVLLESTAPRMPGLLDQLEALMADLEAGAADLPALSADAEGLIEDLRNALGPGGERLSAVLEDAEAALEAADSALGTLEGNSGDLEAALRDLRATMANMRALSKALEERPHRLLFPPRREDRRPGEGVEP